MLDHIFGSKTRVALLKLFFDHPEQLFFVRELTRTVNTQINAVRRELMNLSELGIVRVVEELGREHVNLSLENVPKGLNKKKYYQLNKSFVLFPELSSLFSKSHLMIEKDLLNQLKGLGQVYYLCLSGFFTNVANPSTDMLIVGNVNKEALVRIIKQFEEKMQREINYTTMSLKEFEYRRDITDKFLYDILVNTKIVAIDQIGITQ